MYKYKVVVGSAHPLGYDFIDNLIYLAKEGAEIDKESINGHSTNFPARAYMTLESETIRESTATIKYILVQGVYTREQLEAMKWEDLKSVCKTAGVTGRDRELIINAYLEAVSK